MSNQKKGGSKGASGKSTKEKQLQDEVDKLKTENRTLRSKLDSKGKESTAKEKQLQNEVEKLETENRMLRGNLDPKTIEKELRKANKVSEESLENMLQQEVRDLQYRLKEYESSSGNSGVDVIAIKEELGQLKKEKATHATQISQKDTLIDDLRKELKNAQDLAKTRANDIATNRKSDQGYKNKICELEKEIKKAKSELDQHKMRVSDLFGRRPPTSAVTDEQLQQKNEYEKKIKEKDDRIKQLEETNRKLNQTEQPNQNTESDLDASKPSGESLTKHLQSSLKERDDTIKKQKDLIDEIQEDLNGNLAVEKQKYIELEQRFKDVQVELKEKKEEIKTKDERIQTLQSSTNGSDTKNQNVLAVKQLEISKLDQQLKELKSEHEKLKKDKETLESTNENLMKAKEKNENENVNLKNEKDSLKKNADAISKSNQDNIKKLTDKENEMKRMIEKHKEDIGRKDSTIAQLQKEKTQTDRNRGTSGNTGTEGLKDKHEKIVGELNEAKEEISELKNRLSKVVGAKIMDDNPNITDLSDENRPTKLSEKYSELYDNEWTDAYEEAEKEFQHDDQKVIRHLFEKLLDIFTFCQKTSQEYANSLKSCALSLPSAENERPKSAKIGVTNMRQLKELRKSFSPHLVENVFQHYVKKQKLDLRKKPKTEKFVRECVRICWLMSSQDPPVILDTADVKGAFDGDRFRTYTKTGKTVDFVVWPPMLLHQNGPMLCKGVAQGK